MAKEEVNDMVGTDPLTTIAVRDGRAEARPSVEAVLRPREVAKIGAPEEPRTSELPARPYPAHYVSTWTAPDGTRVTLRPIRPADEPLMIKFHGTLSSRSVSFRYFHAMKLSTRVAHERLTRICFIDYDREMVLVADRESPVTGEHEILGVGRLNKIPGTSNAEFAILISDHFQGMGLGTELLGHLLQIGHAENLKQILGYILPANVEMQRICKSLGFAITHDIEDSVVRATITL
jgi:acetyltransferase